jgi:glycine hydroxymethyltransferase
LNKNAIPDDPNPPYKPSGIRLGTPAITTRGMKEAEVKKIAKWIVDASNYRKEDKRIEKISQEVKEVCETFPLPGVD